MSKKSLEFHIKSGDYFGTLATVIDLVKQQIFEDSSKDKNKKIIEGAISKLTITQKEVIILKYVNEMSLSEAAEIMNIPINTAKSHHRRALIKMKNLLNAPGISK